MSLIKTLSSLITIFVIVLCVQCECPECFTPPQEFALRLVDSISQHDILYQNKSNQDDINFYYFENNIKKNIEFEIFNDTIDKKSVLISGYPGFISAQGIKEFFVEFSDAEIDTIYYDVEEISEDCCNFFETKKMMYNGRLTSLDNKEFVYIAVK